MRYVFVITVLLCANQAAAQPLGNSEKPETLNVINTPKDDPGWVDGSVLLNDGTKDKGQVRYNDHTGVVSFESKDRSSSYNARTIGGFQFQDNDKLRSFYSLHYYSPFDNSIVKQFFEVLREYKDFAVISRTSAFGERVPVEVTTVYLVRGSNLEIMPFVQVTEHQVKWKLFDVNKTQFRVLNSGLPKELMGDNFPRVKAFAKERNLQWHVKDSLISILDYYDSLTSQ